MRFHGVIEVSIARAVFPGVLGDAGEVLSLPVVGRCVQDGRYLVTGDLLTVDKRRTLHVITSVPTILSPSSRIWCQTENGRVPELDIPITGHDGLSGEIEGALLGLNGQMVLGDVSVARHPAAPAPAAEAARPIEPAKPIEPAQAPHVSHPASLPGAKVPVAVEEVAIEPEPAIPAKAEPVPAAPDQPQESEGAPPPQVLVHIEVGEEFPVVEDSCFAFPSAPPEPEPSSSAEPAADTLEKPEPAPAASTKTTRPPRSSSRTTDKAAATSVAPQAPPTNRIEPEEFDGTTS